MTLEEKLNEFKTEGKQEQAIETAKNLLSLTDLSISKISEITSLSEEEIEGLLQEIKKMKDRLNYCVVLNKGCLNYCVGKSYKYPDKYKMSGYFFVSERINLFVVCSSLFTISF